ncbi:MAG: hypothetical protein HY403_08355 [Elusimicrobia bacterium]|nr:hypothetical protein [Elusimicrobiota bacterium]
MTPYISHPSVVAVDSVDLDLARKAAASLVQPHKTSKQIVEDLLARLQSIRRRRELRGLNHWGEFAPTYLQRLLVRHEVLRRRAVEAFFRVERDKAISRAESKLGNHAEAEDAVAEAFLKLLSGKAGPGHFNRVLRLVCIDRIRARMNAGKLFSRERDFEIGADENSSNGPGCSSLSEGDPLEIMLRDEAIREGIQKVQTDWKYRRARGKKWWRELISHHCPQSSVPKGLAQTNM